MRLWQSIKAHVLTLKRHLQPLPAVVAHSSSVSAAAAAQPVSLRAFQPWQPSSGQDQSVAELMSYGYAAHTVSDALQGAGNNTEAAFDALYSSLIGEKDHIYTCMMLFAASSYMGP